MLLIEHTHKVRIILAENGIGPGWDCISRTSTETSFVDFYTHLPSQVRKSQAVNNSIALGMLGFG